MKKEKRYIVSLVFAEQEYNKVHIYLAVYDVFKSSEEEALGYGIKEYADGEGKLCNHTITEIK